MTNEMTVLDIIERTTKRRNERRAFLRAAGGATAMVGGLSLLSACGDDDNGTGIIAPTPTPTPSAAELQDRDVLNFALQLEYLEAQFYSYAAFGTGLNASLQTGTGTQGAVVTTAGSGGTQVPRGVTFTTPLIAEYAREIAYDEIAHVGFLRAALGTSAAAQPAINISGGTGSAFAAAATAAGVPGGSTFDPYANENNFLLGAFIFEDVGVTAYKGAVGLLSNKTFVEAAAGIHAAEAYHAGLIRTVLYNRGLTISDLRTGANLISDARDSLDGGSDLDQGIGTATTANIVPTDANGIAFSRNTNQVLHIVYLNATAGTSQGGFFPAGVNGAIRVAAANP